MDQFKPKVAALVSPTRVLAKKCTRGGPWGGGQGRQLITRALGEVMAELTFACVSVGCSLGLVLT